jgi:hypothetical protein
MNTKPIRVTWTREDETLCVAMCDAGMSTKHIMEETGLTKCQVQYRQKMAGIKRADYRNGTSHMARMIMQRVLPRDPAQIRAMLKLRIIKLKIEVRGFQK